MTAEPGPNRPATATGRPARTVFFGSGAFAVPILDAAHGSPDVELVAVVTTPDRPAGRRQAPTAVPVAARARELGLALRQPPRLRDDAAVEAIADLEADLGVLADYGRIVPSPILELFSRGILNVHPSLLPRHRGAAPIPATIVAGDAETGVTLIRMDEGLDTGPIVAVERFRLRGDEVAPELEAALARIGARLVETTLGPWLRGDVEAMPQPATGATLTRPLRREDGRLDPRLTVAELERRVRAYEPWPGSFLDTDAGRLVVWLATPVAERGAAAPPGTIGPGPDLRVAASDGWLRLDEVQPAGGRRMPGEAWLRGRPAAAGSVVG